MPRCQEKKKASDQPVVKEAEISYALCCRTRRDAGSEICCCSHFPLSSQSFSFFFFPSSLLEEINLAPFAEAGLLPLAIPLCFVSKGQGSAA